ELSNELMDNIAAFVTENSSGNANEIKLRITKKLWNLPLWANAIIDQIENFIRLVKQLSAKIKSMLERLNDINLRLPKEVNSAIVDINAQTNRLKTALDTIQKIIFNNDDENARWIEVVARKFGHSTIRLRIAPINIAQHMNDLVFQNFQTIIMTSATLTIANQRNNDEFHFFATQVGLSLIPKNRILTSTIPAPFDYQQQSMTAIPLDIPTPDSAQFGDAIADFIFNALQISQGRAFILFTSYGLLHKVYQKLESKLSAIGIPSLRQGQLERHQLLEKFKTDKQSVLFATDSFWQGVDVEGEALQSVIIAKLPFQVPSEPILQARFEAIERAGGNPFMEYSLPVAALKLKQGFGRLIRKKTDIGIVTILDKRIIEKFYGKTFLNSLPKTRIVTGPAKVVLDECTKFFQHCQERFYSVPGRDG
ncbi:MAG: helicase C-terminal domain-containing protein, partial [bacterium]|nr:helicase C-terminal domain-containing protein [bacterium]